MLKIVDKPKFTATVVVNTVHAKGEFKAEFVALPTSSLLEIERRLAAAGKGTQDVLYELCTHHDTVELYGQAVPFDGADSLRRLLDVPGIGPAMLKAYHRAQWEEAAGN